MEEALDESNANSSVKLSSETHYTVLGIPTNATDKQITTAYKTLVLKYHPDRNPGNLSAAETYKAVCEAYKILTDSYQKQLYDESIAAEGTPSSSVLQTVEEDSKAQTFRGVDSFSPLMGRFVGVYSTIISRLRDPIVVNNISPDVTDTAYTLCRNGALDGGQGAPLDARVSDLAWGWSVDGRVDRHGGVFYRLNVSSRQVENGFIVHCRSSNKDRFKLIIFDKEGQPMYTEDSLLRKESKSTSYTCATFFFTIFDAYRLADSSGSSSNDSVPLPQSLSKLDSFSGCKRTITPGQYLLCVYGENLMTKSTYNIVAVPAKNDAREVLELEEVDEALVESKMAMETLKAEYIQIKSQYDIVLNKIKTENDKADMLIQAREKSYMGFFAASIEAYGPAPPASSSATTTAPVAATNSSAPSNTVPETAAPASGEENPAATPSAPATASPASPGTAGILALQNLSVAVVSSVSSGSAVAINTASSVGSNAAVTAASTATAAGGWLAKRFSGIQSIIQSASANKSQVESAAASDTDTVDPFVEVAADPAPTSEFTQESEELDTTEAVAENFINSSLALSSASGEEESEPAVESVTRPSTKPKKKDDETED
eukprot:gene25948-34547_t